MLQPNMVIHNIRLIAKLKGILMFHTCCMSSGLLMIAAIGMVQENTKVQLSVALTNQCCNLIW